MTDSKALAKRIIAKLQDSLTGSTWQDQFPEAFDDLFKYYTGDMIFDVQAVIEAPVVQTVRVRRAYSGCEVLGKFIKRTASSMIYEDSSGKHRRKALDSAPLFAGCPKPNPHIEPCACCLDHPESVYREGRCGIHGSEQPCETCMSTYTSSLVTTDRAVGLYKSKSL